MRSLLVLLYSVLICFPASAGKLYSWTDENGKRHYGDRPPAQEELEVEVERRPGGTTDASGRIEMASVAGAWRGKRDGRDVQLYLTRCGQFDERVLMYRGDSLQVQSHLHAYSGDWRREGVEMIFKPHTRGMASEQHPPPRWATVFSAAKSMMHLRWEPGGEIVRLRRHGGSARGRGYSGPALTGITRGHNCEPPAG